MELVAERDETMVANRRSNPGTPMEIECVAGLHQSARHRLTQNQWILIGTADDCDIILSDSGIAPHHCFVGYVDGKISVRAVQGNVRWADKNLIPGTVNSQLPAGEFQIGDAVFRVGDSTKRRLLRGGGTLRLLRWGLALMLPVSIAGYSMSGSLFDGQQQVTQVIASSGLAPESNLGPTTQPSNTQAETVDLNGDRMAKDLREIMRLSGFRTEVAYLGEGVVEVSGYFGEGKSVSELVRSRAIREISGLKKVQIVNHSTALPGASLEESADTASPGSTMIKIVYSKDPYLIFDDGSRYYPGAKLPDGSTLVAIADGEGVVVEADSGSSQRLSLDDLLARLP